MKTIGILAPSGVVDKNKIQNAITFFKSKGYKVKLAENLYEQKRYLAGTDEAKLNELHRFFQDKEIDLIMCARGGYGAIRLVNNIDYDIIKNNPKPFIGFSDVTALLLMIYKNTGIQTCHGAMACSDFGDENANLFSWNHLIKALTNEVLEFKGKKIYKEGCAEGIIWGGNLATVVSLCGLDFIPDENFVFFAEDLNEPAYKIDKMFTQLFNIDKFRQNCKGIILGDFLSVDRKDWLEEFFHEFKIPTTGGFGITHAQEKITIPIGRKCKLCGLNLVIK